MKFKKSKVQGYFGSMTENLLDVSFEEIEANCGPIPPAYTGENASRSKGFSGHFKFHDYLEEVGYRVIGVDYENRKLTIQRIGSPNSDEAPQAANSLQVTPDTVEARILASYNELFSKKTRTAAERGRILEDDLLWYIVYTCASLAAMGYERFVNGEIWDNREQISRLTIEKLHSFQEGCDFNSHFKCICRGNEFGMRLGVWQKMLSVSMKHMYLFHVCTGGRYFRDYAWMWEGRHCYCPVDRIIKDIVLKQINEDRLGIDTAGIKDIVWNYITEEQYDAFQSVVGQLCDMRGISSKMLFDVMYWQRPSKN